MKVTVSAIKADIGGIGGRPYIVQGQCANPNSKGLYIKKWKRISSRLIHWIYW